MFAPALEHIKLDERRTCTVKTSRWECFF